MRRDMAFVSYRLAGAAQNVLNAAGRRGFAGLERCAQGSTLVSVGGDAVIVNGRGRRKTRDR